MKKLFILFFVAATFRVASYSQAYHYDVNGDGVVTAADVTALYDYMLGNVPIEPPVGELTEYTVNGVTFKMVQVEGGTFTMGATAEQGSEAGENENPPHQVTLSSFSIGQTEVTQELWQVVMGSNPSWFNGYGNSDYSSYHSDTNYGTNLQRPVEKVSWDDCQQFITKLSQMTGKNFRLLTEAEWEYAARGGSLSQGYKYSGSNNIDDVAWYYDNSYALGSSNLDFGTHTVATKQPNELGIYDMSGNVLEWCQDWYGSYSADSQTNPTGPATGSGRVSRGGSWIDSAGGCRVSYRGRRSADFRSFNYGLRLAL